MKYRRIILSLVVCSLLGCAGNLVAEEKAAEQTAPPAAETEEISPAMKNIGGILAARREQSASQRTALGDAHVAQQPSVAGRMFQGLMLCLGVFFIGSWIVKRFGPKAVGNSTRRIRVLERTSLSPKASLCLVEVDGRRVLLSTGSEPVQMLMQTPTTNQEEKGFEDSLEVLCAEDLKLTA